MDTRKRGEAVISPRAAGYRRWHVAPWLLAATLLWAGCGDDGDNTGNGGTGTGGTGTGGDDLCSGVSCSGHGQCIDGACSCDPGYSGASCADCADGYHDEQGRCVPDASCADCDADNDGFAADDCDDGDAQIYPGVSVACTADCGEGWQRCQSDGTFSSCECSPLCEASGSGRCFYVAEATGSDDNPGSFELPWATYLNVVSYYGSGDAPPGWVALAPGDVVYFHDGVYDASYGYFDDTKAFYLRGVDGAPGEPIAFRAYPSALAVFTTGGQRTAATIEQSSHIVLDGLEITDAFGQGLWVTESTDVDAGRMSIDNVDGNSAANVAGIKIGSSERVVVHHSDIRDTWANGDISGDNGHIANNIILFGGGDVRIHHNRIRYTAPTPSPMRRHGVTYKHSANVAGTLFEVDHNVFEGCDGQAVGSGSFGSRIHHNLMIDSGSVVFKDFGGPTHNEDNIVEFNTIVTAGGLSYNPTDNWGPVGLTTFARNIVVDEASYGAERGVITIGTYMSDSLYDQTVTAGNLAFASNCYFNPNEALQFNLFAANGGNYGALGDIYDQAGWQALGYDVDSVFVDPDLDADHLPLQADCAGMGWRPQ